jgi:hypothetical protein
MEKEAVMAKIQITGATVDRLLSDKGLAVSTTYTKKDGEQGTEKYTVWTDPTGYNVGDTVNVIGNLSVRVDEFDGDNGKVHYARINVNQPQVEKAEQDMPF